MRWIAVRPILVSGLALLAVVALASCSGAAPAETGPKAGADVQVYNGTHTVRHSIALLPSAQEPREDGRHTLVWFSATW